ncbi:MAG: ADYC domain-containing protein [Kofleriaceae bacterium]
MKTLSIALFALGATACVGPDDLFVEVEQEATGGDSCSDYFCGKGNSDVIDNMGLHDLNVNGLVNSTGFRLTKAVKDGIVFQLQVYGSELTGQEINGNAYLTPDEVVGAVLTVKNATSGITYEIQIADRVKSLYWATIDGVPKQATSYQLLWKAPNTRWQNLCVEPPLPGSDDLRGGQPAFNAFLFEGDRINAGKKTFSDTIEDGWFNIGCMGHALAKLHLTGHTEAAKRQHGFPSDTVERQTFLRMIVADYCHTGQPFTVAGQPLDYMNASTLKYVSGVSLAIEARWDKNGATCMGKARTVVNPTPQSLAAFPHGVYRAMYEAGCTPPPQCIDQDVDSLDGHYLNSANPYM